VVARATRRAARIRRARFDAAVSTAKRLAVPSVQEKAYTRALRARVRKLATLLAARLGKAIDRLPARDDSAGPRRRDTVDDDIAALRGIIRATEREWNGSPAGTVNAGAVKALGRGTAGAAIGKVDQAVERIAAIPIEASTAIAANAGIVSTWTAQNVDLIKTIDRRHFGDVARVVEDSLRKGRRTRDLKDDIAARFGVSDRRAQLIARDQLASLNMRITEARQTELGIAKYRWTTSGDERVRDEHSDIDGQIFTWAKGHPTEGHPGEPINCRCVAVPVFKDGDLTAGLAGEAKAEAAARAAARAAERAAIAEAEATAAAAAEASQAAAEAAALANEQAAAAEGRTFLSVFTDDADFSLNDLVDINDINIFNVESIKKTKTGLTLKGTADGERITAQISRAGGKITIREVDDLGKLTGGKSVEKIHSVRIVGGGVDEVTLSEAKATVKAKTAAAKKAKAAAKAGAQSAAEAEAEAAAAAKATKAAAKAAAQATATAAAEVAAAEVAAAEAVAVAQSKAAREIADELLDVSSSVIADLAEFSSTQTTAIQWAKMEGDIGDTLLQAQIARERARVAVEAAEGAAARAGTSESIARAKAARFDLTDIDAAVGDLVEARGKAQARLAVAQAKATEAAAKAAKAKAAKAAPNANTIAIVDDAAKTAETMRGHVVFDADFWGDRVEAGISGDLVTVTRLRDDVAFAWREGNGFRDKAVDALTKIDRALASVSDDALRAQRAKAVAAIGDIDRALLGLEDLLLTIDTRTKDLNAAAALAARVVGGESTGASATERGLATRAAPTPANQRAWRDSLSTATERTLESWGTDGYVNMRNADKAEGLRRRTVTDAHRAALARLHDALATAPAVAEGALYRGASVPRAAADKWGQAKTFKPNAVSSWSRDLAVAEDFATGSNDSWVLFEIRGGTSVGGDFTLDEVFHLLPLSDEREVIIPKMKYRIVTSEKLPRASDGKVGWRIVVEEMEEQ